MSVERGGEAQRRRRVRRILRGLGLALLTAGLLVAVLVPAVDRLDGHRQQTRADELRQDWRDEPTVSAVAGEPAGAAGIPVGSTVAVLHVPRLGAEYRRVVVEGTGQTQPAQGPGHYVGTAMPGRPGNFALAGHRVGDGSPFLDLDRLRPGDPVVVETPDAWFTYRVLGDARTGDFAGDPSGIPGRRVVAPTDVEVVSPTPGEAPDAPATGAYLTLTTCHPKDSARQRLIVHAVLDGAPLPTRDVAPGGPAVLHEG